MKQDTGSRENWTPGWRLREPTPDEVDRIKAKQTEAQQTRPAWTVDDPFLLIDLDYEADEEEVCRWCASIDFAGSDRPAQGTGATALAAIGEALTEWNFLTRSPAVCPYCGEAVEPTAWEDDDFSVGTFDRDSVTITPWRVRCSGCSWQGIVATIP